MKLPTLIFIAHLLIDDWGLLAGDPNGALTVVGPDSSSQSVRLFSEFILTIVRAKTNRSKPRTGRKDQIRMPDLYVYITGVTRKPDGSPGKEFYIAKTRTVKGSFKPYFNESFAYERDQNVPFTIGTDHSLRLYLFDQAIDWGEDISLGYHEIDLAKEVEEWTGDVREEAAYIEYYGYKSTVYYKFLFKLATSNNATRKHGARSDDDYNVKMGRVPPKFPSGMWI